MVSGYSERDNTTVTNIKRKTIGDPYIKLIHLIKLDKNGYQF